MAKSPKQHCMDEFAHRVKSVLWRSNPELFKSWKSRVDYLKAKDGGGYTTNQAMVLAAKEFPALKIIFRDYDLREFDPTADTNPVVWKEAVAPNNTLAGVINEGKELTYKQALQWAIDAAGKYMRTGENPVSCPCDSAYYLYQQAITEPKDFLGRVGQVESKDISENKGNKDSQRAGKRSIREIELMIEEYGNYEC